MAKSAAERQADYRARAKDAGDERINVIASKETVKRLRLYALREQITQAEALDEIVERLWGKMTHEERSAIEGVEELLEERRRARVAGDTSTLNLF